jgi:hypothetical protein
LDETERGKYNSVWVCYAIHTYMAYQPITHTIGKYEVQQLVACLFYTLTRNLASVMIFAVTVQRIEISSIQPVGQILSLEHFLCLFLLKYPCHYHFKDLNRSRNSMHVFLTILECLRSVNKKKLWKLHNVNEWILLRNSVSLIECHIGTSAVLPSRSTVQCAPLLSALSFYFLWPNTVVM